MPSIWQPDYPFFRTRGFASPGYPEFAIYKEEVLILNLLQYIPAKYLVKDIHFSRKQIGYLAFMRPGIVSVSFFL